MASLPAIKGVLNWIAKKDGLKCEFRLYEKLFLVERPELNPEDQDARRKEINPNSLVVCPHALINKSLASSIKPDSRFQFERLGFFSVDLDSDIEKHKFVFNRILETQTKKKD